jgi:hypothetical protein
MAVFPILRTSSDELGRNDFNNYGRANEGIKGALNTVHATKAIDVAAGGTITVADADMDAGGILKLINDPGGVFTVDLPDGDRRVVVWNASGGGDTATLDTVTGSTTTVAIADGEIWELILDGVEIVAKHQWTLV